jgi:hypothetical protein
MTDTNQRPAREPRPAYGEEHRSGSNSVPREIYSFSPRYLAASAVLAVVVCIPAWWQPAAAQEIGLVPLESQELARGYRASVLKLKLVVNDKSEQIGRIDDFVFGRDGHIFVVLAVGEFFGIDNHLVAIPFQKFKLNDRSGNVVLPGASRAALEKLPVFFFSP